MEKTLFTANFNNLDQAIAAMYWFGTLDEFSQEMCILNLDLDRAKELYDKMVSIYLYDNSLPFQTDFDMNVAKQCAKLLIARAIGEGWYEGDDPWSN